MIFSSLPSHKELGHCILTPYRGKIKFKASDCPWSNSKKPAKPRYKAKSNTGAHVYIHDGSTITLLQDVPKGITFELGCEGTKIKQADKKQRNTWISWSTDSQGSHFRDSSSLKFRGGYTFAVLSIPPEDGRSHLPLLSNSTPGKVLQSNSACVIQEILRIHFAQEQKPGDKPNIVNGRTH